MDCSYPSANVATGLLHGLPKSRRGFAGIHHRAYIETGAHLLTICWVATIVSFVEEGGRHLTLTTHLCLVLKAQKDWRNPCVRKSHYIESCSTCPVCDDGLWRWEYLRATLWGSYSFLLLFYYSSSFHFLIFIFTSYSISCFIPFSYFSHSYYFISYLRRSRISK